MPRIVELKPANPGAEYLPPVYYLKFSQEEFPAFLANPTTTLAGLGHQVDNLVVTVKDHVWDAREQKWVTQETDKLLDDLPPARNWEWWCGYQDEMCVCEKVLVP